MLQVRAEPRADSVGEHNANVSLSRIQWRLMLPPKIPIWDKKHLSRPPHGKGDSHGLCRLLLGFPKQGLTVQKYAVTDVAEPLLGDTHTEIMTVAVSQESNTNKCVIKPSWRGHFNHPLTHWHCVVFFCRYLNMDMMVGKEKPALLWKTTGRETLEKWEKESTYWPTEGII